MGNKEVKVFVNEKHVKYTRFWDISNAINTLTLKKFHIRYNVNITLIYSI